MKKPLGILAEHVGTRALVPPLVELALATGGEALGTVRTVNDVAAEYARACQR